MKEFAEILGSKIGVGEPILTDEIMQAFPDMPRCTVYRQLNSSIEAGDVVRFDRGVYCVPEPSIVPGFSVPLNPETVLRKKYICDGLEVFGFRSGLALLNDRGISNQVPVALEITTNRSPRCLYRIKPFGGYREIVLRKPRVKVNAENVAELELLDVLGWVDPRSLNSSEYAALMKMVNACNRKALFDIAQFYPAKTLSNLMKLLREIELDWP